MLDRGQARRGSGNKTHWIPDSDAGRHMQSRFYGAIHLVGTPTIPVGSTNFLGALMHCGSEARLLFFGDIKLPLGLLMSTPSSERSP